MVSKKEYIELQRGKLQAATQAERDSLKKQLFETVEKRVFIAKDLDKAMGDVLRLAGELNNSSANAQELLGRFMRLHVPSDDDRSIVVRALALSGLRDAVLQLAMARFAQDFLVSCCPAHLLTDGVRRFLIPKKTCEEAALEGVLEAPKTIEQAIKRNELG